MSHKEKVKNTSPYKADIEHDLEEILAALENGVTVEIDEKTDQATITPSQENIFLRVGSLSKEPSKGGILYILFALYLLKEDLTSLSTTFFPIIVLFNILLVVGDGIHTMHKRNKRRSTYNRLLGVLQKNTDLDEGEISHEQKLLEQAHHQSKQELALESAAYLTKVGALASHLTVVIFLALKLIEGKLSDIGEAGFALLFPTLVFLLCRSAHNSIGRYRNHKIKQVFAPYLSADTAEAEQRLEDNLSDSSTEAPTAKPKRLASLADEYDE